jgi:hypothetical protein
VGQIPSPPCSQDIRVALASVQGLPQGVPSQPLPRLRVGRFALSRESQSESSVDISTEGSYSDIRGRGRLIPSRFINETSVVRFSPRASAAPPLPPMRQPDSVRTLRTWARSISTRFDDLAFSEEATSGKRTTSVLPVLTIIPCSIAFLSSLTFPGQEYRSMDSTELLAMRSIRLPILFSNSFTNVQTNKNARGNQEKGRLNTDVWCSMLEARTQSAMRRRKYRSFHSWAFWPLRPKASSMMACKCWTSSSDGVL